MDSKKSYYKEWRKNRKEKGLCFRCENKAMSGKTHCFECSVKSGVLHKDARERRRSMGMCSLGCGAPAIRGKVLCKDCRDRNGDRQKKSYIDLKRQIVIGYGGSCQCPKCPLHGVETDDAFLTLDHIHNDGAKDRKLKFNLQKFYKELIQKNFPKDRIQLLCWNCNCGKSRRGGKCPHEENHGRTDL